MQTRPFLNYALGGGDSGSSSLHKQLASTIQVSALTKRFSILPYGEQICSSVFLPYECVQYTMYIQPSTALGIPYPHTEH